MKKSLILISALVLTGIMSYTPSVKADDEGAAKGFFAGGLTGAAIGGLAGGGKGAAIGGLGGAFLGTAIGASQGRGYDNHYDRTLDKLYKKQDRLSRKIQEATSENSRAKYQKELNRVNRRIAEREGR